MLKDEKYGVGITDYADRDNYAGRTTDAVRFIGVLKKKRRQKNDINKGKSRVCGGATRNGNAIFKGKGLDADEYYDTVVFAFLDCVIKDTKGDFKQRAYAAMDNAVDGLMAENEEKVISLYQNDDYYRTVEETLTDETDGVSELLERIRIEELLKLFAQNEREVLTLLLDGFNISEISFSLKRSVSELESTIRSIRIKAAGILPAAA